MGCDIHFFVERRDESGKWVTADRWTRDEDELEEDRYRVDYENRFYSGRNYDLFGILANVRNGRGFAGVDTGEGFVPIAEPRGLPEDVTDLVQRESDGWGVDGHSHSYFTVAELLAYDWTQVTLKRGVVNGPTFFEWIRWRKGAGHGPESYSGGVFGCNIKNVTDVEMQALVDAIIAKHPTDREALEAEIETELKDTYARVEWAVPYYDQVEEFLGRTMPKLWRLGKPEDVRIVFFFDN